MKCKSATVSDSSDHLTLPLDSQLLKFDTKYIIGSLVTHAKICLRKF